MVHGIGVVDWTWKRRLQVGNGRHFSLRKEEEGALTSGSGPRYLIVGPLLSNNHRLAHPKPTNYPNAVPNSRPLAPFQISIPRPRP